MSKKIFAVSGEYNPEKLFSVLMERKGLTTTAQLAALLKVTTQTIRNIKLLRRALSLRLLNRIQEVSGMSYREMRDSMDARRQIIRMEELAESK